MRWLLLVCALFLFNGCGDPEDLLTEKDKEEAMKTYQPPQKEGGGGSSPGTDPGSMGMGPPPGVTP